MKDFTDLIKAIGDAHITADIIFAFALLLISFKVDVLFKQHLKRLEIQEKRQENFYKIINEILKRQNKIIGYFLDRDNHKGGNYFV